MHYGDLVLDALVARGSACWARLDDAVDELISLHAADPADILDRVKQIRDHAHEGGLVDLRSAEEN